ncbi:sigma-70 family RNA polymerase sigma factor [Paenibacillus lautus]|uniref:sigma-70 family RNA polymerase sigma factor n=1 Tax=Paenibacillus lautus TaxID=1401 RepID=UPI001D376A97|nr:sigma-70 family RNA polymerase sigma factor [Paenibacillus lautus]MBX4145944.1 sigma-70 family RNA polymerase sigma factor [Paenibacillus lautus]
MEHALTNEDIEKHNGMVHRLAGRYHRQVLDPAIDYEDLVAEAQIGLLKAYERFDPNKGFAFSTFAFATVTGYLQIFLARRGTRIRFPAHAVTLANKIYREGLELEPLEKIAKLFGKPVSYVQTAIEYLASLNVYEIDRPQTNYTTGTEDEKSNSHFLVISEDDNSLVFVDEFLSTIKPRDREVVELVMKGFNYRQIGNMAGVSHQAIWNRMKKIKDYYIKFDQGQADPSW